jgi:hypothetical protein
MTATLIRLGRNRSAALIDEAPSSLDSLWKLFQHDLELIGKIPLLHKLPCKQRLERFHRNRHKGGIWDNSPLTAPIHSNRIAPVSASLAAPAAATAQHLSLMVLEETVHTGLLRSAVLTILMSAPRPAPC